MPTKLTAEDFIERSNVIHNNKYDYSNIVYTNTTTQISIFCKQCNKYYDQLPKTHLQGKGCKSCASHNLGIAFKKTKEQFVNEAQNIHNNKYNYDEANYINNHSRLKIFCNQCNNFFYQTPIVHINQKCGCSNCSIKKTLDRNKFIDKAIKIHGNKYNYDFVCYINNKTKVIILCNQCEDFFKQLPNAHVDSKQGCPKCIISGGEKYIEDYLLNNSIRYIRQFVFNSKFKFDFYLPELNYAIEFDGRQHFEFVKYWHKDQKGFEKQIERDRFKDNYCTDNNIKLIRIKYDENIEEKLKEVINA